MNCKPGDLAVVVKCRNPANLGKILTVTRFIGYVQGYAGKNRWATDLPLTCFLSGAAHYHVQDEYLRPLRDNDGEDEMLRIAGRPQPHKEIA